LNNQRDEDVEIKTRSIDVNYTCRTRNEVRVKETRRGIKDHFKCANV